MKIKLMVSLLVLCLTLSIVSVQAQTNALGTMDDIDMILTGNIIKTITCNVTGNAVVVEGMDDMIEDTDNVTDMNNVTENMTDMNITGKMVLIRDMTSMAEKAVMIGKLDNIGKVIIFGKTENVSEEMYNVTEGMDRMTVLMTGNMTGTVTLNMTDMNNVTEDMNNVTEDMNNVTEDMNNVTEDDMIVSMTGNMTGVITGDMTKKMVIIRNMGNIKEMAETMCNITEMEDMDNITEPMRCDMTGKMVIIKGMDDIAEMDEDKDILDMIGIDGDTAIIGNMDDITAMEEDMDESMDDVTGKVVMIRSMDDMIRLMSKTFTCDITHRMTVIEKMTDNMTGRTVDVLIDDFAFDPASVTISTGDTIRWTNMQSVAHTATGPIFDSGLLEQGDSYEFTFTEPGIFEYHCTPHPFMQGNVTVIARNQ